MTVEKQSECQGKTAHLNNAKALQKVIFVKHLEESSRIVQSWPVWKQQLLGGKAVQQEAKEICVNKQ